MNMRTLHFSKAAQNKENSSNHGLEDPYVYVASCAAVLGPVVWALTFIERRIWSMGACFVGVFIMVL